MIQPKHILVFMAILALGLIFEGIKSVTGFGRKSAIIKTVNLNDLNGLSGRAFSVSKSQMLEDKMSAQTRASRSGFKLAGATRLNEQYDFSEGHKVIGKDGKRSSENDPTKKKKRKKRKKKKSVAKQLYEVERPYYEEIKKVATISRPNSQVGQFLVQTVAPNKIEDLPITFEDWAKLILGRPQPENVNKLVSNFQTGLVSGDIFYALLYAMLEEPNEEQHILSVNAAAQVPNAQSFSFLVDIIKTEKQGSTLAELASNKLNSYESLGSVFHLASVLSIYINDPIVTNLAVNILDRSTKTHLEGRQPADDTAIVNPDPTNTDSDNSITTPSRPRASDQSKINRAYKGFPDILERVILNYASQNAISFAAKNALDRINKNIVVRVNLRS